MSSLYLHLCTFFIWFLKHKHIFCDQLNEPFLLILFLCFYHHFLKNWFFKIWHLIKLINNIWMKSLFSPKYNRASYFGFHRLLECLEFKFHIFLFCRSIQNSVIVFWRTDRIRISYLYKITQRPRLSPNVHLISWTSTKLHYL